MKLEVYGDSKNGYAAHGEYEPGIDASLLPCPFCAGTIINVTNTHSPYYWAECKTCGAEVSGNFEVSFSGRRIRSEKACRWVHEKSFHSAIKVWNTRFYRG